MITRIKVCVLIACLGMALPAEETKKSDQTELRAAAERGDAKAQYELGRAGGGVEFSPSNRAESDAQSVFWLRKAAAQGYAPAAVMLANYYRSGRGVEKDWTEAARLDRQAAEQGLLGAFGFGWAVEDRVPSTSTPRNFYAEGMAALQGHEVDRAVSLLIQVPENDPKFLDAMVVAGWQLLAESAGKPERGLPLVERAYQKAPDEMAVAYAYIRVQLLARMNLGVPSVAREHRRTIPDEFRFIAEGPKFADSSPGLAADKLLADLDYLELMLANCYSYLERRGVDWRAALDALRLSVAQGAPRDTFILRLKRFMTIFGDPHSEVRAQLKDFFPTGYAPFMLEAVGDQVVVGKHDRSGLLDADCPYLVALDNVPIADWLRVAGYDIPKASPQHLRLGAVGALAQVKELHGRRWNRKRGSAWVTG